SGSNAVNHSHLELGNFILQKDQVRWVVDLGADNYNLPAYFGNLRWTYYRLSTRGQNTICIDDQNQNPKGSAVVQNFQTSPDAGSCSTDLTDAYRGQLESLTRSVRLDRKNSEVVIRDEIGPGVGENVGKPLVWQFHTRAKIEVSEDGKSAVLTQSNGTKDCTLGVHLTQATNSAARFEVRETTQGPDENPNTGVLRLVISVPVTAENQVLEVKFTGATK
ncbi:MAG: heparinase II/III-family protein, partial [Thermoguttaceae bacterium]|nr:heparinase II/III-family protein [Thermoguttaceae bacterium]